MDQKRFLGLMDMIDGGGTGRSGQTFEGGPLSAFLNALGVRPAGYMDRLEAALMKILRDALRRSQSGALR